MAKKINSKARSRALSAARQTAMRGVAHAAFVYGTSTHAVADAVRDACGTRPTLVLYQSARDAFYIGRVAAGLPSQSDETEQQRLDRAKMLLTKYQGFGGKAKLRDGMLGRRTKEQELLYGAARVAWTGICKLAGVKVPEARGGDTSKTRRPQPAKKATAKKAATVTQLSPKVKNAEGAVTHIQTQAKALAAFCTKNAGLVPSAYGQAVVAFHKAIFKSVND